MLSLAGILVSVSILLLFYFDIATVQHTKLLAAMTFFLCVPLSVVGKIISFLALIERPTWVRGLGMIAGVVSIGVSLLALAVSAIGMMGISPV